MRNQIQYAESHRAAAGQGAAAGAAAAAAAAGQGDAGRRTVVLLFALMLKSPCIDLDSWSKILLRPDKLAFR